MGSSIIKRKAGVLILQNLPYTVHNIDMDTEGRRVSVTLSLTNAPGMKPLMITSIYTPNTPNKGYYQDLAQWFFQRGQTNHVVGGDFNSMTHEQEDRKITEPHKAALSNKTHNPLTSCLQDFMLQTRLIDVWRYHHPTAREYAHYSHVYSSFSRINYFLVTPNLLASVLTTDVKYD